MTHVPPPPPREFPSYTQVLSFLYLQWFYLYIFLTPLFTYSNFTSIYLFNILSTSQPRAPFDYTWSRLQSLVLVLSLNGPCHPPKGQKRKTFSVPSFLELHLLSTPKKNAFLCYCEKCTSQIVRCIVLFEPPPPPTPKGRDTLTDCSELLKIRENPFWCPESLPPKKKLENSTGAKFAVPYVSCVTEIESYTTVHWTLNQMIRVNHFCVQSRTIWDNMQQMNKDNVLWMIKSCIDLWPEIGKHQCFDRRE